jgi:hypothetical protein
MQKQWKTYLTGDRSRQSGLSSGPLDRYLLMAFP